MRLLDIGCGEGRNAVFFARNGYDVTAFDLSPKGVEKTKALAEKAGVHINAFEADLLTYRLEESFDILFSTGVFHYVPFPSGKNCLPIIKIIQPIQALTFFQSLSKTVYSQSPGC